MQKGCVYLVGAGPGDPELLTVKGLRLIQAADVILYDGLANPSLLLNAKPECDKISVEKKPGFERVQQDDTNQLLVDHAKLGKCVVRLKGGDPVVFGRGGEEAEVLKLAGIPFEIVPGISSAIAAPAYAGIPVTHRGVSTHFTVVTGTTAELAGQHKVNWELLGEAGGTLLILMGTRNRAEIAQRLVHGGRSPDTPVAAVYRGTLPTQKTLRTTLQHLADADISNPSVIVVGAVAGLDFSWFELQPLLGRRIAVTRARTQASDLVTQLSALGADVLEVPTIEIHPPDSWADADQAILELDQTDWLVFTSTNGVDCFFDRVFGLGKDIRAFAQIKIAAIGAATKEKVRSYHLNVDLEPKKNVSEGLLAEFAALGNLTGSRILIAGPETKRPVLSDGLREVGANVREAVVYKTVQPKVLPKRFKEAIDNNDTDLITFTSSSTVTNLVAMLGDTTGLRALNAACIGPVTAKTAETYGLNVVVQPNASEISINMLVTKIVDYFNTPGRV
ncbi:MAG: uroporphyrinogen-III C-methyltransferase [Candidatus Latescibacteria bacterium]|nr:uroporphyrinogen-III C-methyltransferase [Candidatus Latescibacterota bacterium]